MKEGPSWFRSNQIFFNYAALGVSAIYMGWVYMQGFPTWFLWVAWFFNPLTIYGVIIMYLRRQALYDAYEFFSAFWAVNKYEKEHGVIEIDEEENTD